MTPAVRRTRNSTALRRVLTVLPALGMALATLASGSTLAASPPLVRDIGTLESGSDHGGHCESFGNAVTATGQVSGLSCDGANNVGFVWTTRGGMKAIPGIPAEGPGTCVFNEDPGRGVNAQGDMALGGETTYAELWTPAGGATSIGALSGDTSSFPNAIGSTGDIVGISNSNSSQRAFFWSASTGMVAIGTLGGTGTDPLAVNGAGHVTGGSDTSGGKEHAFFWTKSGGMTDLGVLSGDDESEADGINASDAVVGVSTNSSSGDHHAFYWTSGGGMVDLGTLGGTNSCATQITDAGQVLGISDTSSGATHAFSWTQAGGMVDIGVVNGFNNSFPMAANASGEVVGRDATTGTECPCQAFAWTKAGGLQALGLPSNTVHVQGSSIDAAGDISGVQDDGAGYAHATIWCVTNACREVLDSLTFGPGKATKGKKVTLSTTVADHDTGNPVQGLAFTFTLGKQSCHGVTNSGGVAKCSIKRVSSRKGKTTLTAVFAGSLTYQSLSQSRTFTVK